MRNIYLSTINKCTKTIVIIIVINVESFLERHFLVGYQLTVFKNKPTFMQRTCSAYNQTDGLQSFTQFIKCKPRKWIRYDDISGQSY